MTGRAHRRSLEIGLDALGSGGAPPSPIARVRRLAGLERADIAVIGIYSVAIGLVSLAVPVAAQMLVNTVAFTALVQPVVVLSILVLVGLLAAGALGALQYQVVDTLQQRLFVRATHAAVTSLTRADVRAFSKTTAPELVNRFFDVAIVQKTASTLLLDGISVVLQGAVSLVLLAFYHPILLAYDVVLVALIVFVLFGLGHGGVSTAVKESKAKYATAAWLENVAISWRALKSNEGAAFAFARADALARHYVEARREHFEILFRQLAASHVLHALATAALLGLGGALVLQGQLTLGQLVAAELIVNGVLASVSKFGKYLESFYDLTASVDKLSAFVDVTPEPRRGVVQVPRTDGAAHLVVEHVGYAYESGAEALRDVSLDVPRGARVAILGGDAGGKSTLTEVLYGLRAPTRGVVKIDGIDIRTLAVTELRRHVAVVGDAEIVDGTVLENLQLARQEADVLTMTSALEAVSLSDDIERLPDGIFTVVGTGAYHLTSSQAIRLAIARAIVGEPRLLIIDSALDGLSLDTVGKLLDAIGSFRSHTSLLVLTSRAEIADAVGAVVRLERGVTEERTPASEVAQ